MYVHPRESALSCDFYISQLDYFMQNHIPNVQIGFSRGKTLKHSKEYMQTSNSPREGETTYGGSFNQSELTILN